MANIFQRLNNGPVDIEYVPDEHEEARDFEPSFWFDNRRYFISDFIKVQNNPWIGNLDYPEYIHAMETDNYYDPLYVELIGDSQVNIYRTVKEASA